MEVSRSTWMGRLLEWLCELGLHGRRPGNTPPFAPDRVRRILVAHHYGIGDVLCATPTFRALRRAFPGAHLAVLVAEYCRAVVEQNPDVDEVFTYTRPMHRSGWLGRLAAYGGLLRVTLDLRARRFDLAVSIRRRFVNTTAWLSYASGAPWRLGYLPRASHPFRFFLNLGREPEDKPTHEVDVGLELLAAIGVPAAGRELTVVPDPAAQAVVRERLAQAGIAVGEGLALVHISSRRVQNRWPLASFAEAADLLRERLGLTVLLSWAPGDATNPLFPGDDGKAWEVAARMRTQPILLPTPKLPELMAAVSLSNFVLSSDGGLMHIAAALRIPQVALFGRITLEQWRPVNEKSVVFHRDGLADGISVEEVVSAATSLLARWGRAVTPAAGGMEAREHETREGGAR